MGNIEHCEKSHFFKNDVNLLTDEQFTNKMACRYRKSKTITVFIIMNLYFLIIINALNQTGMCFIGYCLLILPAVNKYSNCWEPLSPTVEHKKSWLLVLRCQSVCQCGNSSLSESQIFILSSELTHFCVLPY